MLNSETACHLVDTAVDAIQRAPDSFAEILDDIPAPLYVVDPAGSLTYYNEACVELAGRTPQLARDRWCVTAKLFTLDGTALPHEECPMAEAVRQQRPVRDVEAIAERPDGTRFHFIPYPTPLFAEDGTFMGAVNLLLDVTDQRKPDYLRTQAERCRRLGSALGDQAAAETMFMMAAKYDQQAGR